MKFVRLPSWISVRRAAESGGSAGPLRERPIEEVVDGVLDREIGWSRELDRLFKSSPGAANDLHRTQDILDKLRAPSRGPDLAESILSEVGRRRGWLAPSWRRFVSAGRLAAAACVVLALGALYFAERQSGGAIDLAGRPAPLSEFVQASSADLSSGVRDFAAAVQSVASAPVAPQAAPTPRPTVVAVVSEWPRMRPCSPAQSSRGPTVVRVHRVARCSSGSGVLVGCVEVTDRVVVLSVAPFDARRTAPDAYAMFRPPQAETAALFGVPSR